MITHSSSSTLPDYFPTRKFHVRTADAGNTTQPCRCQTCGNTVLSQREVTHLPTDKKMPINVLYDGEGGGALCVCCVT